MNYAKSDLQNNKTYWLIIFIVCNLLRELQ
jgi:hypothetical protein